MLHYIMIYYIYNFISIIFCIFFFAQKRWVFLLYYFLVGGEKEYLKSKKFDNHFLIYYVVFKSQDKDYLLNIAPVCNLWKK